MQFSAIPGLEDIKSRLIEAVNHGRVAHAQLFLGAEGSANLAMALAYTQYINCEHKGKDDSCGTCKSCQKTQKLVHPDVHFSFPLISDFPLSDEKIELWRKTFLGNPYLNIYEWMAALGSENKQGNIAVSEIRNIIKKLSFRNFEAAYKVMIIWLPEFLKKEGNILLKIIEEPAPNTVILLVAQNQDAILSTIRSRTQLMRVRSFDDAEIENYLKHNAFASHEDAKGIAFMSEGNMNLALTLCKNEDTSFFQHFRNWLLMCYHVKIAEILKWGEETSRMGRENIKHLLLYGIKLLRECILFLSGAEGAMKITGEELIFVRKFATLLDVQTIEYMVLLLNDCTYHIERNASPKISLFNLSLHFKNKLANSKR
jgi:DNA polymerase-3 subunit delta'